jgi:hypothetical protein
MVDIRLDAHAVREAIRALERIDLEAMSMRDLDLCLSPLFRGYGIDAPTFDDAIYVYRGRKCSKPTMLSEISYPPSHAVTAMGRANDIGESMFYCGTGKAVPLVELGAQPGDLVALSTWKTKGRLVLSHVGFSSKPASFKEATRKLDEIYQFVRSTRERSDLNALVHDYLAHMFSKSVRAEDHHHYKLTTALSRKMLAGSLVNGLLYPTIEMSGNADNIVLKKEAVDRLLQFVSVEYICVRAGREMQTDIDILDSATRTDPSGKLHWSGRALRWRRGEQLRFADEFGELVAYDASERRIDPE